MKFFEKHLGQFIQKDSASNILNIFAPRKESVDSDNRLENEE